MIERSEEIVLRENILGYIGSHYEKNSTPPSISTLVENVYGLNRSKFYEIFQGGIAEPCSELGIPAPMERIASTEKARKGKGEIPRLDDDSVVGILRFLGESDPRKAMKITEKIVADHTQYAMNYGLKNAGELVKYFEDRHEVAMARILELAIQNTRLLEDYFYENDEELMEQLDIPLYVRQKFRLFRRRRAIKTKFSFIPWLCGTFTWLFKAQLRKNREEEDKFY